MQYQRTVEGLSGAGIVCWGISAWSTPRDIRHIQFYWHIAHVAALFGDPHTVLAIASITSGVPLILFATVNHRPGRRIFGGAVSSCYAFIARGLYADSGFIPGVSCYSTLCLISAITALGLPRRRRVLVGRSE